MPTDQIDPPNYSPPLFDSTGDEFIDQVLTCAIGVTAKYATPVELDRLRDAVAMWGEADQSAHMERWPKQYGQ